MQSDVRKPGIPVFLPCAIACWVTSAISYTSLLNVNKNIISLVAVCSLTIGCTTLFAALFTSHKKTALIAMFAFLGVLLGSTSIGHYNEAIYDVPSAKEWTFTLRSDPKASEYGYSADAEGVSMNNEKVNVKLYLNDREGLFNQATIFASTSLRQIEQENIDYYYKKGISATASIDRYERLRLDPFRQFVYDMRSRSIEAFEQHGGEQAGILQALVCGYRDTIEQTGQYDQFKLCGLAHIVAVSGAHLAIVTAIFGYTLRAFRMRRSSCMIGSSIFVIAYLLFAGIPISAVRAAIMVILSITSGLFKRRNASLSSLSICIVLFIAFDPSCAVSVSLILSAGSTFGIIIFSKLIASWFSSIPKPLQKAVGDPLALTFSSNIVTMPYSVATFGLLPLISPIANVIATPLFSIACVVGLISAIASCIDIQLGSVLIALASLCSLPLSISVDFLSSIAFGCVQVEASLSSMLLLTICLFLLLWKFWPKLTLRSIAIVSSVLTATCAIAFALMQSRSLVIDDEMIMLDVGQGDAFLITSNGASVLIDTGNQDRKLLEGLNEFGIKKLSAVLITHADDDHCGSLQALASNIDVDHIGVASEMLACGCDKCRNFIELCDRSIGDGNVVGLSVGSTISVGDFELEVIWPEAYADEGGNSDSLCLVARIDCNNDNNIDWTALFTGDAESSQLEQMVQAGLISDVDILKVGHHGSKASLSQYALDHLKPETALISVGSSNRYGHPTSTTLNLLEECGANILRTDERGSVRLVFSEHSITVK